MSDIRPSGTSMRPISNAEKKFLVVGGSGFVGRHLVDRLRSLGHSVMSLSRAEGFDILQDELPLADIHHVFHLAARTGVANSWQQTFDLLHTNVCGTARLLEQCRRRDCPVTFLSTFLYATQENRSAKETDRIEVTHPYGLSKHVGEQICTLFADQFGLRTVILRPSNIYGPGQSANFLIPHVVSQILDDRITEVEVHDLAPARDYIHIADVVDGMILSMQANAGTIFNLGSGTGHSVEDVIQLASAVAGVNKPYRQTGQTRQRDVGRAVVDISSIRNAVGWSPRITLESGLRSVVESMRPCRP
jgi:nucleoside-diphosphate-sugar epimerase